MTKTISILSLISLIGCASNNSTISYTNACPKEDQLCQRNMDAQTLSVIGQRKAAIQLMCQDPKIKEILGEAKCNGELFFF